MALHLRGSGGQPMVLYDSSAWESGVTLMKRDCGIFSMRPESGMNITSRIVIPNSVYGVDAYTSSTSCVQNDATISILPKYLFTEYSAYSSVRLDKQPFLFANDLIFTAVEGQKDNSMMPTWSIMIQRIYSNQANDFTIIPFNQNIPSMRPCNTPADCSNIAQQCMSAVGCKPAIPYGFEQSGNAIPLGTSTQRYALWVTNPSLEPFYAFSAYCRNRGQGTSNLLQISVTSSYGGIRLWRMNPYIYCPKNSETGAAECPDQQDVSSKIIASLDFQEFDIALCDQQFYVMAVDLDYINEDNLALTVLKTTLSNLNVFSLGAIDETLATYETIWINPNTLETRTDTLWMPEASSPALTQGFLCPSQRRMPNAGSMLAEAVNAIVFLLRMPINVFLSSPSILDFASNRCSLLNRGHQLLKNCGKELFNLDDFFASVYRSNALFWQSFSIIANQFGPGTPQSFINGAVAAAENRLTYLPYVVGGLEGVGNVKISEVPAILANSIAGLPSPIAMANIAMQNPVAMFQFYYNTGSKMLVDILRASQQSISVANLFWNVVANSINDYDVIVLQRMRRICSSFSIVMGYNTPLGKIVERWCTAHVEFQKALLNMASVFFVDVPLMDCICIKSKGSVISQYIIERCWSDAPDLMKPFIGQLVTIGSSEICSSVLKMTQTHFTESLDTFFELLESGTRELSNAIDYFIQINYQGDCNNFVENPYVLTLIPQPVDYFRVCGKTETCKFRCLSEFQAFESKNIESPHDEIITQDVKSLFFNSVDDDTIRPLRSIAMLELNNCTYPCGFVQNLGEYRDRCFLLGGENNNGQLEVVSFCVPVQLGSNVRRGKQSFIVNNMVHGALQAGFVFYINPINFWQSFRLLILTQNELHVCHTSCLKMTDVQNIAAVRFVQFQILGNDVIVETLIRSREGSLLTSKAYFCFSFDGASVSNLLQCQTNVFVDNTHKVCQITSTYDCSTVFLIPKISNLNVQVCNKEGNNIANCIMHTTDIDFTYRVGLTTVGTVSQSVSVQGDPYVWHIFATAPNEQQSHWLQVMKIVLDALGSASGSLEVGIPARLNVNVRRKCSLENCVGCRDLALQRLCYAASECQVARCIGTTVHQRRPLCSIGMNLAATVQNQLSLVEGAWLIVSETMVSVLSLSGGVNAPENITWPDKAFFAYICSAKDMTSTAISIVTSSLNGIVQSIGETPMAQANQPQISNNAFILFSMTMAATTNFLNQVAMFPLYSLIATQKIFVCNANSVLAVIGGDRMSVTIGDHALQKASDKSAGKCISQYFEESSLGAGTGTNNEETLVNAAMNSIVETFAAMKLEMMIHPMDAALTWLQGVVSGLQDVIQTMDRNRSVIFEPIIKHRGTIAHIGPYRRLFLTIM